MLGAAISPVLAFAIAGLVGQPASGGAPAGAGFSADADAPQTRRLVIPIGPRTQIEASSYMGEGLVELSIAQPAPGALAALQDQVGEIVERVGVTQDDADLLKAQLYMSVPFPQVEVKRIARDRALIDVTVHPHALTPKEPIDPPVLALEIGSVGLPLPAREITAQTDAGKAALDALDKGDLAAAIWLARKAIDPGDQTEPVSFFHEVHAEVAARELRDGGTATVPTKSLEAPESAAGKLAWILVALAENRSFEADEALRGLDEGARRRLAPYVQIYGLEIDRRVGRASPDAGALKKLLQSARSLPDDFARRAALVSASALLERGDLPGASLVLASADDAITRLWRAEVAYLAGDERQATALFKRAAADRETAPFASLRLVDLGAFKSHVEEEDVLRELNLRSEADAPAMLARARLLERGMMTKTHEATLSSLSHLAASDSPAVALDAEMRLARLKAKSGHPAQALESVLKAETHAGDKVSRTRARAAGQQYFVLALEQCSRWRQDADLLRFVSRYEELLGTHPESARLVTMIAAAARRTGDTELTVKYLVRVAAEDTSKHRHLVLASLAETYLENGDLARAKTVLSYAEESGAAVRSAEIHRVRAEVELRSGRHEEAIASWIRAADLAATATHRTSALARAADVALENGDRDAAKRVLSRLLEREHPSALSAANARVDLATIHLLDGRPQDALPLLARVRTSSVAERTPDLVVAQATYFAGEAHLRAGEIAQAERVWRSRASGTTPWDRLSQTAAENAAVLTRIAQGERSR